jgi:hypothetical protein
VAPPGARSNQPAAAPTHRARALGLLASSCGAGVGALARGWQCPTRKSLGEPGLINMNEKNSRLS